METLFDSPQTAKVRRAEEAAQRNKGEEEQQAGGGRGNRWSEPWWEADPSHWCLDLAVTLQQPAGHLIICHHLFSIHLSVLLITDWHFIWPQSWNKGTREQGKVRRAQRESAFLHMSPSLIESVGLDSRAGFQDVLACLGTCWNHVSSLQVTQISTILWQNSQIRMMN